MHRSYSRRFERELDSTGLMPDMGAAFYPAQSPVELMRLVARRPLSDVCFPLQPFGREVRRGSKLTVGVECTPASGQGQAADLTVCRACSSSNLAGLRYPSAEWSRLLL